MTMSPDSMAPLALQKIAGELTTLEGMAKHLALLASGNTEIRRVAVRWFNGLPRRIQIDMVRSIGRNTEDAAALVMLVPEASMLLPHLGVGIVRRISDRHPVLLTALTPRQLATLIRITKQPSARLEWLALVIEWEDSEAGLFDRLVDELDAVEIADILAVRFHISDIDLLLGAMDDPTDLEAQLMDEYCVVRDLYASRPDTYRTVIGEIILRLADREERRSRLRTLDELQRRYWPGLYDEEE